MLNRLKLENFKAWRKADLTFGKVTGFFGTNSAGKSSLLHLLLMLKQTRNATDRGIVLDFGGPGSLVNLGTFEDVVHRHDKNEAIGWHLDWTLPERLTIEDPLEPSAVPRLLLAGNLPYSQPVVCRRSGSQGSLRGADPTGDLRGRRDARRRQANSTRRCYALSRFPRMRLMRSRPHSTVALPALSALSYSFFFTHARSGCLSNS